jgi:O-methyltransferase involved in polyketide biosynthesis
VTELEDQGLPLTALAIAAGRAVETSRPDGLVADPFALALVEAARSHVDFPTSWPADPAAASPLLGRLSAEPQCELIKVATDLSLPWREPLRSTGFDPQQRTTWILEGLLPYLDAAAQLSVLKEVAALSAPGSRAVIERAVPLPKTDDVDAKLRDFSLQTGLSMSEVLARADPPDPAELLTSAGWLCDAHSVQELCAAYNRTLSLDAQVQPTPSQEPASGQSRGGFVTALR